MFAAAAVTLILVNCGCCGGSVAAQCSFANSHLPCTGQLRVSALWRPSCVSLRFGQNSVTPITLSHCSKLKSAEWGLG